MIVLHIIAGIARQGGGPSRSSQGLVAGLRAAGVDAWLMTLNHGEEPWIKGCEKFINGGSFEEAVEMVKPDIVHLHGIWQTGLHCCAVVCRRRKIPYVIAPRGMLEPWSLKQKWLKKRVARWLYQDRDLKAAAALHATAESEAENIRRLGFKNPIIISPNGVNVPANEVEGWRLKAGQRRVLFVSRMHPKKGVLELVESWSRVFGRATSMKSPRWACELVYTLNGDTEKVYEAQVKTRVKKLGLEDQFIFTGPLDDDAKWEAYGRADLFVLPTYSENFGIVVAEALWAGLPVITTKGTPWEELEGNIHSSTSNYNSAEGRCGWWIGIGVEPLADALRTALNLPREELEEMGRRGRALVEEKYTWKAVGEKMVEGYEEMLTDG